MRVADSFWINSYEDYKELEELYNNGMRLASGLMFSHEIKCDDGTYYCFMPTDNRVDGCIYVTEYRICDVFSMLNATVSYEMADGNILTFDGSTMIINHGKAIKYKHDSEFCYKLQKTQYKSRSPYEPLEFLVNDFWRKKFEQQIRIAYF